MNMPFPSRSQVEAIRKNYPLGTRVMLNNIERTYSACSWMTDEAFQYAIGNAVDEFLGEAPAADIF